MNRLSHKQQGLSLVELMIAITISLILILGVIQVFSSSKQTNRVQSALARLQENARFALDLLSHDIRMAGQIGCNSKTHISNNTGELREFGQGIFGYEYSDTLSVVLINGHPQNPDSSDIVEDTDAIAVMNASANAMPASSTTNTITAVGHDFETGNPLIISDCDNADLFIAGDVIDDEISIKTASFSKTYNNAELATLNYLVYYVRENNGQRNLYRSFVEKYGSSGAIRPRAEPLLEGVEDFQILYGENINGNGQLIRYVDADSADMDKVTSVRIHLLLSTLENNLATVPQEYWFNGEYHQAAEGDRRLFRSFTATIQLRNQGIGI